MRFLIIALSLFVIQIQAQNIEELLFELPDVIFEKVESEDDYGTVYKLKIKQPLDHFDTSKGYFYQKTFLTHISFDSPTVMVTRGYSMRKNAIDEPTELLKANQIGIEHRYFGESVPDSLDYNYLNMKQATADLHRINQLFRKIYSGKWISTGISKGGATAIFYEYFYPNDIDVSIPYVAPIKIDYEDKRIYTFLDTIGTAECRSKIKSVQIRLLENRDEVLPLLKFYSIGANLKFTYLTFEQAFEYAVLEYPFSFWQWGGSCDSIPSTNTTLEDAVEYFVSTKPLALFGDDDIEYYGTSMYQNATEMGYYGYEIEDYKHLIKALPINKNPHATFMPNKMKVEFDGTLLKKVNKWIRNDGNKFIYIYGTSDTWSACAVKPSTKVDSKWFFLEGKHHRSARIKNMNEEEKQELISTLEGWLSIGIE
ncbi:S28 family serine protease [Candidatus Neomarinimicrobiota bacterium]